jgi:hypothetical protein
MITTHNKRYKIFSILASFVLLVQSILPTFSVAVSSAYAQETTPADQVLTPIVEPTQEAPTVLPTEIPTVSPASTVVVTPSETTDTPTPVVVETAEGGEVTTMVVDNKSAESIDELNLDPETVVQNPSVVTDKADYAPTDAVVITGTGFSPNSSYIIYITADGGFSYSENLTTDEQGSFIFTYQLDGVSRPLYTVEIKDESGNVIAQTIFRDPPAANLDQVRNGSASSPTSPGAWVNGNAGASNAHYIEGYSIPYRVVMTDLPTGTPITITLGYDIKHSDHHAIDYLTSYDRLDDPLHQSAFGHAKETIDPTIGISGVSGNASDTHDIPAPSASGSPVSGQPTTSFNALPQSDKQMSIWNGTISTILYASEGSLTENQSETQINVTFTPNSSTVVLAWGGHIASREDWRYDSNGVPLSAGGISGSPYHMRLIDWTLNNLGNQDRSLSAVAVYAPPSSITIIKDTVPEAAQDFSFTTTGTGLNNFSLDDDADSTLPNSQTFSGLSAGTYTVTEGLNGMYAVSIACNDQTGNTIVDDSSRSVSIDLAQGEDITCTFINTLKTGTLRVIKHVVNDNGGTKTASDFNLHVKSGDTDVQESPSVGSETGTVYTLNEGTYVVSEDSPPDGYSLTGYSGECDSNGAVVVVANQEKVCTITNDDQAPSLTLVKEVTNDNGGQAVPSNWTLTASGATGFSGAGPSVSNGASFDAGVYNLSESGPSGYLPSDWVCVGGTQNDSDTVTVGLGQDVTCTISNDDIAPKLKLVKVVTVDNGGSAVSADWDLTASGSVLGFTDTGDSAVFHTVQAGVEYTLSESGPEGYTASAWGCTGGTLNIDKVTLGLSEEVVCTITNDDQSGHLIVHKVTNPASDQTVFSITASGTGSIESPETRNLSTSQSVDYIVDAGTYSVTEADLAGWDETGNTCTDVVVENGGTSECTITNTKRGNIVIVKDVIGNPDPTDFTFHNNFGNGNPDIFLLDEDTNATLPSTRNFEVLPGTYAVFEDPIANWQSPESTSCDSEETIASIDVGPGEIVTCTFVNEELINITLVKNTIGGDGTFDFNLTGSGLPATTQLITSSSTASQIFSGLDQDDAFSITEVLPNGWDLTSAECTGGETPDNITPEKGEDVTCTFTNTKRGHIIVDKVTDGGDDTFSFDATGGTNPVYTDFILTGAGNPNDQELKQGNYSVTELSKEGWYLDTTTCLSSIDDTETAENLELDAGETITCTFHNTKIKSLEVTKTATAQYKRLFKWTIDKSVTPETLDMFTGDSGNVDYTVAVTKDTGTDSNFQVSGSITVSNPNSLADLSANITSLTDIVSGDINMLVMCRNQSGPLPFPLEYPIVLTAGGSLQCKYIGTLPDKTSRINTATVTTTGLVPGGNGTADVIFGEPTHLINDSITVNDTNGGSWPFSDDGSVSYDRTFSCDRDEGKHDNTATIAETGQSNSASVTVNCYDLEVTKDAHTSYDKTWSWDIEKSADQTSLKLSPEQTIDVNYSVTVNTTGSVDSNWAVDGMITVHNPAPIPAMINTVADTISGVGIVSVDCPVPFPYELPAGGDLVCTYSSALSNADNRTNTATASLQNTPSGTTDFSGSANVDFTSAAVNEIDECVEVTDTYGGTLGTVCKTDTLPKTFNYTYTFGPYTAEQCGAPFDNINTATFTANDTGATGSDLWNVNVTVACVCSLTQGYWKTHSVQGPAAHPDDTWNLITPLAENTPFYFSGQTYLQVLQTSPRNGNAYYILAHQYIAAKLNSLNGAVFPSNVQIAFNQATNLFNNPTNTPSYIVTLKGKLGNDLRAKFTTLAGTLGAFNEGKTNPAGHCSEIPL